MHIRCFRSHNCICSMGAALCLQSTALLPGSISCWFAAQSPKVILVGISRRSGFELGSLQESQELVVILVILGI